MCFETVKVLRAQSCKMHALLALFLLVAFYYYLVRHECGVAFWPRLGGCASQKGTRISVAFTSCPASSLLLTNRTTGHSCYFIKPYQVTPHILDLASHRQACYNG